MPAPPATGVTAAAPRAIPGPPARWRWLAPAFLVGAAPFLLLAEPDLATVYFYPELAVGPDAIYAVGSTHDVYIVGRPPG